MQSALNSTDTFVNTLRFLLGSVWSWFQNTEMPFFGVSVGTFWIALAVLALIITVLRFWLFDALDSSGVSSRGGGSGKTKISAERKND